MYLECKYKGYMSNFEIHCLSKFLDVNWKGEIKYYDYKGFLWTCVNTPENEYLSWDSIYISFLAAINKESF